MRNMSKDKMKYIDTSLNLKKSKNILLYLKDKNEGENNRHCC